MFEKKKNFFYPLHLHQLNDNAELSYNYWWLTITFSQKPSPEPILTRNQLKADGTISCNYNKTQDIEIQEIKKYDSCRSTQWIMS